MTIEAVSMPGKGATVTGNLRDVMKESISAASSYVRARSIQFGVKPPCSARATSTARAGRRDAEGRSVSGRGVATAIMSVLTGVPIRKDVAMTGDHAARARAADRRPVRSCWRAARRREAGADPKDNEGLADIPENVKTGLEIVPVSTVDEVLKHALTRPLTPIEWTEEDSRRDPSHRNGRRSGHARPH